MYIELLQALQNMRTQTYSEDAMTAPSARYCVHAGAGRSSAERSPHAERGRGASAPAGMHVFCSCGPKHFGVTRRLAWALRCPCYEWHMMPSSQLFGGMAQMLCLDHPWLQVVTNNRRVFQRIARTFAELAQSLVPGHTFALRSSAEGPHKVVKQSLL